MRRRSVLSGIASAVGVGATAGLAGCLQQGGSSGESVEDHPAANALDGQPFIGEAPLEAEKLIVAFEDPTCTSCSRFHTSTFDDVRSEIVEPDSASFVYRPYRYTGRSWATPAIHAVLETTARDRDAAWELLGFYYDTVTSLSGSSFATETRSFLETSTSVDAEAVIAASEARTHQSVLETAEADGDEAGVVSTPTFYLFQNGTFETELTGSVDVTAFEAGFRV
ncbi:DsbA family protein [Salinarchaeum laminariae]|uniref:DsbA family protein n=1 Tax=Salinarchaeum laminariae TaxID=869888 RepID=UPI0020BE1559|nr:thioredoxin domain-containing protein [Salinarchaeum laminariae]